MGLSPLLELPAGHLLLARYKIVKRLGAGGYGSVYLAQDMRLGARHVAIKELHDPSEESRQLFEQEARLLARLIHPNLVRVTDFFEEGEGCYLVMDYVEGQDLLDLIMEAERTQQFPLIAQVTDWMTQICEAVAYLHGLNPPIIHRDIKPANIRLSPSGRVILVDFGIAKVGEQTRTQRMARAISQGFSPPEQYGSHSGTDMRSDIYALGATCYCLLAIRLPPDGFELLTGKTSLRPPSHYNPAVPEKLETIVLRAMSVNSAKRYANAGHMLKALQEERGLFLQQPKLQQSSVTPVLEVCPKCKTALRAGARFCNACGMDLRETTRCPHCNALTRSAARFCTNCGKSLRLVAEKSPALGKENPQIYLAEGERLITAGQFQQAVVCYKRVLHSGLSSLPVEVYLNLGQCYNVLEVYPAAVEILSQGLQAYPKNSNLLTQLGIAHWGKCDLGQAIYILENVWTPKTPDVRVGKILADLYAGRCDYKKSALILECLYDRHPNDSEIKTGLALNYLLTDQLSRAEHLANSLQRAAPRASETLLLKGALAFRRGKLSQALTELSRAKHQTPVCDLVYYYQGEVHYQQKQWQQAMIEYQLYARANKRDPRAYVKISLCLLSMRNLREAAAALQQALALDSQNPLALRVATEFFGH